MINLDLDSKIHLHLWEIYVYLFMSLCTAVYCVVCLTKECNFIVIIQVCCICDICLFYAVLPDFSQVYGFIGSVFDPNTSGHLQTLKKMDPIDVETVYIFSFVSNLSFPFLV